MLAPSDARNPAGAPAKEAHRGAREPMKTTRPPSTLRVRPLPGFDNVLIGPWPLPACEACGARCTLSLAVFNGKGDGCWLCPECMSTERRSAAAIAVVRAKRRLFRSYT